MCFFSVNGRSSVPDLGNQANTFFVHRLHPSRRQSGVEGLHRYEANKPSTLCDPLKTKIDVCFVQRFGGSMVCCNCKYQSVNTVNTM